MLCAREAAINPYYKAWLAVTGGGDNTDFMSWIISKHREFQDGGGRGIMPKTDKYRAAFGAWLEAQCFELVSA